MDIITLQLSFIVSPCVIHNNFTCYLIFSLNSVSEKKYCFVVVCKIIQLCNCTVTSFKRLLNGVGDKRQPCLTVNFCSSLNFLKDGSTDKKSTCLHLHHYRPFFSAAKSEVVIRRRKFRFALFRTFPGRSFFSSSQEEKKHLSLS